MVEKRGNVSFVKSNNFHFHYERKTHWSGISEGWTDAYVVPFKKTKKKNVCGFSACSWKTPATNYVLATHVLQMIYESGSDFSYHMNRSDQARLQRRLLVLDSHQEPPIKYSGGEGVAPALNNAVFTHLKRPLHLLHRMWHHSAHKVAFTHLIVRVWAKFTRCNEYKDATMNFACVFESKYAYISTETYYTAWTALETKFYYCSETSVSAV